jgi:hypothetical protein
MPHEVVLGAVYTALKALLVGYAPLTALLATKQIGGGPAVYDEGEQAVQYAALPYLTIGAGTQIPDHTMGPGGRYGWNCTVLIKSVSKGTEGAGLAISSQVAQVLYDGRDLNLAGYGSSWCEEFTVQPTLIETIAGVLTRSSPAIVRVRCHD